MVATDSAPDHPEVLVARLHHLLRAGWDARLLCGGERFAENGALADLGPDPHLEVVHRPRRKLPPPSLVARPMALARYLRSGGGDAPFGGRLLALRPDLVHYHSGSAGATGIRLKDLHDCRVVVSFRADGRDVHVRDPDLLWGGADLFLFPNQVVLERAVAVGCPPHRAEVMDAPWWTGEPAISTPKPGNGSLRILSAGPLTWEQGFEHSVHAVRLLLDQGIECEYRIVGGGFHLTAVAFARHQLGLGGHVQLIGPDAGVLMADELREADVVLDPAVADSVSPTPLLAAQAFGVPYVATIRDGLAEDAGIAVPRRDPRAIAEALATLARDPGLRVRMGGTARAVSSHNPRLEDHFERLEQLYRRALG
jgi:glycosyltransferase involved in cell wall biosynthesis